MGTIHLPSIFLITILLCIGLMFFIRASVKDRTESIDLHLAEDSTQLTEALQAYFQQRAYRVVTHNPDENQFVLEGMVAPSLFLACFLSVLAAIGFLCITLVLTISAPQFQLLWLGLPLLSPLAGVFYWRQAQRVEQVSFKVTGDLVTSDRAAPDSLDQSQSWVTVTAHRDELIALRQRLTPASRSSKTA
jgi:hypothetical protein